MADRVYSRPTDRPTDRWFDKSSARVQRYINIYISVCDEKVADKCQDYFGCEVTNGCTLFPIVLNLRPNVSRVLNFFLNFLWFFFRICVRCGRVTKLELALIGALGQSFVGHATEGVGVGGCWRVNPHWAAEIWTLMTHPPRPLFSGIPRCPTDLMQMQLHMPLGSCQSHVRRLEDGGKSLWPKEKPTKSIGPAIGHAKLTAINCH